MGQVHVADVSSSCRDDEHAGRNQHGIVLMLHWPETRPQHPGGKEKLRTQAALPVSSPSATHLSSSLDQPHGS